MRRTRTRSVAKSENMHDPERGTRREENGVGNREIVVLRTADGHVRGQKIDDEEAFQEGDLAVPEKDDDIGEGSASSRDDRDVAVEDDVPPESAQPDIPFNRNITFADELDKPQSRLPRTDKEQSIAFVENQRNPKEQTTFRIPGPRDYDRGLVPERIEESMRLNRATTNTSADGVDPLQTKRTRSRSLSMPPAELNNDDHPIKSQLTFDVPEHMRRRANGGTSAYNFNRSRRRSDASENEAPSTGLSVPSRMRSRSRTFSSFLTREREEEDPMPYLSWTPTVGRNSAFVDLTEDQREELGGIEYRALKLLAIVLVCYFVGFHLLGMICLLPWIVNDARYSSQLESVGVSPVWW